MTRLSVAQLTELLSYDPLTGLFTWRISVGGRGTQGISGRFPSKSPAGSYSSSGYGRVRIQKKLYYLHRLAWALTYNAWPLGNIDHEDGDPSNNRLGNLRDGTQQHNIQNQRRAHPRSTSGLLGVGWHESSQSWRARITVDKKEIALGLFATAELAHAAYLTAKRKLHKGCTI